MITFVCVLKVGGGFSHRSGSSLFKQEHAVRLAKMSNEHCPVEHEVICMTDMPRPQTVEYIEENESVIKIEPLRLNMPGWWSKLEAYRIPGPAILFDLDTSIVGDLTPLVRVVNRLDPNEIILLRPWRVGSAEEQRTWTTGVVAWSGDMTHLYEEIRYAVVTRRAKFTKRTKRMEFGGLVFRDDRFWTSHMIHKHRHVGVALQELLPNYLHSYKNDLASGSINPTGSIVCFHGNPRPWEVSDGE